jgi:hypothetical protein
MYPISEKTLSFTTTAMPRPELLEQTYSSFTKQLMGFDFKQATLYINIDSFPNNRDDEKKAQVAEIARKYFGNVVVNMPEKGNFASAVKWCFSKIETYYNFHLEDDWQLLTPLQVSMFNQFFLPPHVQQVALRAWKFASNNFWLSPSFLRGSFCRTISEKMNTDDNPEVQIRNLKDGYRKEGFIYFPFDNRGVILKDLGRNWMKDQEFNRGMSNFTNWEIREKGKGKQELADQNAQIPNNMFPNGISKSVLLRNQSMIRNQQRQAIRLSKKGKFK